VQGKNTIPDWLTLPHVLESIADGVVALDTQGSVVYASERALRYLGREEKEVLGQLFSELVREGIGHQEISALRNLEPGKDLRVDCAFSGQKDSDEWARVALSPVHQSEEFVGAIATLTNIGDFKEAAVQQLAGRAQFDTIFHNLPFECWLMARDGSFVLQNHQSIERLGEVGSNTIECVGLPDDTLRDYQVDFALANQGEEARRDVTLAFDNGSSAFAWTRQSAAISRSSWRSRKNSTPLGDWPAASRMTLTMY
jgi:PAS domain S-box-containing protein